MAATMIDRRRDRPSIRINSVGLLQGLHLEAEQKSRAEEDSSVQTSVAAICALFVKCIRWAST
jgi:hypothetical protein